MQNHLGLLYEYAEDILTSDGMLSEKSFLQHGTVSVYEHSVAVAIMCISIAHFLARYLHIKTDERSLVRGALLHDYFLYDWHISDKSHRFHGFSHPKTALKNAQRDFELNKIEKNMILRHMFPLTFPPPRYREGMILCVADKICALSETIKRQDNKHKKH